MERRDEQRVVELIERLDDALLIEAAAEALDVELDEALADALQAAASEGVEAAHSLVPAQAFVRAAAATLDPSMTQASGSYALWLALMEARQTWALQEVLVKGIAARYVASYGAGGEVISLATYRDKLPALGEAQRVERPAPQLAAAASDESRDGRLDVFEAQSGWSAEVRWPARHDDDDAQIRMFVNNLPTHGELFMLGIGRRVRAGNNTVVFSAGELREATDEGLIFVTTRGDIEIAALRQRT